MADWERNLDGLIAHHQLGKKAHQVAFVAMALATSLLPTYLFQSLMGMGLIDYLPYYIIAPALAVACLTFSYDLLYNVKFTHVPAPAKKGASAEATATERMLRHQEAIGHSLLLANALFLGLALFFQLYMFRAFDKRVNFVLSTLIAGGLVYWIAQANEKASIQKRLKQK
eukprot:TRINITY_DN4938_c0_g1_i1.p1 TRINITY_DN4938_c0_g1~~TRINITY_DN4938_c0_g1_i1.p1  ORF type:complete len:177 (+),score=48.22 TRINITY_DN4938_c0_g1_i1:23-532(+)